MKVYKKLTLFALFIFMVLCIDAVKNQTQTVMYEQLPKVEQNMLRELDLLFKANDPWEGFRLSERPLLLARKGDILASKEKGFNLLKGYSYAVNVKGLDGKYYAKKIRMPKGFKIPYVYRLSLFAPAAWESWNPVGNFGRVKKLGETKDVFMFKYNKDTLDSDMSSNMQFAAFLPHEAFHFFMQQDWDEEEGRGSEDMSKENLYLTGLQYEILDRMNTTKSRKKLKELAGDYIKVMNQRIQKYKDTVLAANKTETIEGCATYIALTYSRQINNQRFKLLFKIKEDKNRNFLTAFSYISTGLVPKKELFNGMLYDTGATLCMTLDRLDGEQWKRNLNGQKKDSILTLYEELERCVGTQKRHTMAEIKRIYDPEGSIKKMCRI